MMFSDRTAEVWARLDLPSFDYEYMVSSLGRVRRCAKQITYWNRGCVRRRSLPERVVAQQTNRSGYAIVSLQRRVGGNDKLTMAVAPLVCRAFNGEPPSERLHCAHLDGDKANNAPTNLAWVTAKVNCSHKASHGTSQRGEKHGLTRLTDAEVRQIRKKGAVGPRGTKARLAAEYGVSRTNVTDICKGRTWGHLL
jgi:hypothetical protein